MRQNRARLGLDGHNSGTLLFVILIKYNKCLLIRVLDLDCFSYANGGHVDYFLPLAGLSVGSYPEEQGYNLLVYFIKNINAIHFGSRE